MMRLLSNFAFKVNLRRYTVGARFHTGAYKSLRNGVANMDVLAGAKC
jgi:hypothetical protein